MLQPRFFRALTFCIFPEGAEQHLWDWIMLAEANRASLKAQRARYRGDVLRFLLEAQAFWAPPQTLLDLPVQSLERAMRIRLRETGIYVPFSLALRWLNVAQGTDAALRVSEPVFQKYQQLLKIMFGDSPESQFQRGFLGLYRPTPDPLPALAYWKQVAEDMDEYARTMLNTTSRATAFALRWHIILLVQCLHRNGDAKNARWILDLGREHRPDIFTAGPPRVGHGNVLNDFVHFRPVSEETKRARHDAGIATREQHNVPRYAAFRALKGS